MSKTIRVSDDLYEVIDDAREKNETFQDVIEELASEAGLFPSEIRDVDGLRQKLQMEYGYEADEVRGVLAALRYVYTGQEKEQSIGVPHAAAEGRYQDEIDTLQRLGLVEEEHYTGKYDYGYRTTQLGEDLGSELVRELLDENAEEITQLFDRFDDALLSVLVRFGFGKTDTGHLTDRGSVLGGVQPPDIWDIYELKEQYRTFTQKLRDLGIAAYYNVDFSRTVLPPEFRDFLNQRADTELDSVMRDIEVYQVLLDYAEGDLENRYDILDQLDAASEADFKSIVEDFYEQNLTSRYLSNQETPLLIKDADGVRERVETEVKGLLNID